MIDVVFLLLLFFFVAAKWRPNEDFLPLKLPAAYANQQIPVRPEPLVLNILAADAGCSVQIAKVKTVTIRPQSIGSDLENLLIGISDTLIAQKRTPQDPVEIICAPQVKWDYLARIYNGLCGLGMTDITFTMNE